MRSMALLIALLPLWACSSTHSAQPAGGEGGTDGVTDASPTQALGCSAIFDCAAQCSDEPCSNQCLARGSPEAQQATLALADCVNAHSCSDATCLKANCQAETDACVSQGQPVGTPLEEGGAMPGSVPSELVGSWVHGSYGEDERFKLNADGTGYFQSAVTNTNTCAVTQNTTWEGTVVIDATTITVYATTVSNTRFECGQKTETSSPPQTLHFTYSYDAGSDALSVIDNDCAAKYPDSPSSQSLYCRNAYTRE